MLETKELAFHTLLHSISLKFYPGILYGILGPNGSGKSTLFKTLAKIWQPTKGHVQWNGEPLHQRERREISRIVSLVPQDVQIHFDFTVREVVAMGRYAHQSDPKKEAVLLKQALTTVDALHLIDRRVTQLSMGERQRIYIARALMTESPVLLLDEPASNLDIKHQLEIWQLLQNLKQQNMIVIVATHDIAGVKRFCDQAAIIQQGRCVAHGATGEVMSQALLQEIFGVVENSGQYFIASNSSGVQKS